MHCYHDRWRSQTSPHALRSKTQWNQNISKRWHQDFHRLHKAPWAKIKILLEHESEESPVIHVDKVSAKTKEALRNTRTGSKNYDGAAQDDFFIVESLLSFREGEVEVKWVGFEKTTWEPEASIPGFLR